MNNTTIYFDFLIQVIIITTITAGIIKQDKIIAFENMIFEKIKKAVKK